MIFNIWVGFYYGRSYIGPGFLGTNAGKIVSTLSEMAAEGKATAACAMVEAAFQPVQGQYPLSFKGQLLAPAIMPGTGGSPFNWDFRH